MTPQDWRMPQSWHSMLPHMRCLGDSLTGGTPRSQPRRSVAQGCPGGAGPLPATDCGRTPPVMPRAPSLHASATAAARLSRQAEALRSPSSSGSTLAAGREPLPKGVRLPGRRPGAAIGSSPHGSPQAPPTPGDPALTAIMGFRANWPSAAGASRHQRRRDSEHHCASFTPRRHTRRRQLASRSPQRGCVARQCSKGGLCNTTLFPGVLCSTALFRGVLCSTTSE